MIPTRLACRYIATGKLADQCGLAGAQKTADQNEANLLLFHQSFRQSIHNEPKAAASGSNHDPLDETMLVDRTKVRHSCGKIGRYITGKKLFTSIRYTGNQFQLTRF